MSRTPVGELPDWPRMLGREEAARYLGVSDDVFDQEVRAGLWPPALRRGLRGGRLTWDRLALDRAADRASGLDQPAFEQGVEARETARAAAKDATLEAVKRYKEQSVRRR
jgi:hypothetical protein